MSNNKRPVKMYMDGILLKRYESIVAASEATGITHTQIVKVCKGKNKRAGCFVFRYEGRVCGHCNTEKPYESFSKTQTNRLISGKLKKYKYVNCVCKECRAQQQKNYRLKQFIDSPLYRIMGGTL